MNGRCGDDSGVGKFTFVGSRGCSLVDYVLVSESIFDLITSFKVNDPNSLTGHCLIEYTFENSINIDNTSLSRDENVESDKINSKYRWRNDLANNFVNTINTDIFVDELSTLTIFTNNCSTDGGVDSSLTQFSELLNNVTDGLFKSIVHTNYNTKTTHEWVFRL